MTRSRTGRAGTSSGAHLPQSELHDLIVELRSLTLGVGSFARQFDHMAELTGRTADKVIQSRAAEAAQGARRRVPADSRADRADREDARYRIDAGGAWRSAARPHLGRMTGRR